MIGSTCFEDNRECPYCNKIYIKTNFRVNRLKCKDCERMDGRNYRKSNYGKKKSKEWLNNNSERMKE